jgi:hypothetical protein
MDHQCKTFHVDLETPRRHCEMGECKTLFAVSSLIFTTSCSAAVSLLR